MSLGTHIHGQYLHGIQIPTWKKKTHQHLNVSVLSASILLGPFSAVGFAFAIINVVHASNENSNC